MPRSKEAPSAPTLRLVAETLLMAVRATALAALVLRDFRLPLLLN